jgi:hypothetical protein
MVYCFLFFRWNYSFSQQSNFYFELRKPEVYRLLLPAQEPDHRTKPVMVNSFMEQNLRFL